MICKETLTNVSTLDVPTFAKDKCFGKYFVKFTSIRFMSKSIQRIMKLKSKFPPLLGLLNYP